MRVIKPPTVYGYMLRNPRARAGLTQWLRFVTAARWQSIVDVRATYPHADGVTVASGRTVVVFNIGGNSYRLMAVLHYGKQLAFVRDFMTHAEYDRDTWKGRH